MVSNKTIKGLDFKSIEEYFEYIIDSKINGQRAQSQELYKALSVRQKDAFNRWYLEFYYYDAVDNDTTAIHEWINLQTYLNS